MDLGYLSVPICINDVLKWKCSDVTHNGLGAWYNRSVNPPCPRFVVLQPERRQTKDPKWLALSPGPRTHPAALSRHRGGQASLLQTVRCLCFWVSVVLPDVGQSAHCWQRGFTHPKYVCEFNKLSLILLQSSVLKLHMTWQWLSLTSLSDLIIDTDFRYPTYNHLMRAGLTIVKLNSLKKKNIWFWQTPLGPKYPIMGMIPYSQEKWRYLIWYTWFMNGPLVIMVLGEQMMHKQALAAGRQRESRPRAHWFMIGFPKWMREDVWKLNWLNEANQKRVTFELTGLLQEEG